MPQTFGAHRVLPEEPRREQFLDRDVCDTAGCTSDITESDSFDAIGGAYARKHNPWVDFSNVPSEANQPFTAFPSDYARLPTVSFVIPDLNHDMHDGTIAQADQWLRDRLGGYAAWAPAHRSLLLVTADEDDSSADNQIPTIIAGAFVRAGRYDERIDHYRLLSTLAHAHAYDVAAPGAAKAAKPITDIWSGQ